MEITRRKPVSLQLNITPLIDIVFLLLIFFMLTSTFIKEKAIDLSLPQSESATVADQDKILQLGVIDEFTYVLNGTSFTVEEIRGELEAVLLASPKAPPVLLQIDEEADVQLLIDTMDMLKGTGFAEISLAAKER